MKEERKDNIHEEEKGDAKPWRYKEWRPSSQKRRSFAAIQLTGDRQCHVAYVLPHTHPLEINDANSIPSTNVEVQMSCEETAAEINVDSRERHIVEHGRWIMGGMPIQIRPSAQGAEMTRKPERANVAKGELMKWQMGYVAGSKRNRGHKGYKTMVRYWASVGNLEAKRE